jgi:hypothetical protein
MEEERALFDEEHRGVGVEGLPTIARSSGGVIAVVDVVRRVESLTKMRQPVE